MSFFRNPFSRSSAAQKPIEKPIEEPKSFFNRWFGPSAAQKQMEKQKLQVLRLKEYIEKNRVEVVASDPRNPIQKNPDLLKTEIGIIILILAEWA